MGFYSNRRIWFALSIIWLMYNSVSSEEIKFMPCSFNGSQDVCDIERVIVEPCPEALNDVETPCNFYRGSNTTLEVKFRPKFNSTKLSVYRYSVVVLVDVPDPSYTTHNACEFTQCPVSSRNLYTFKQTSTTWSIYPTGQFLAKWIITGSEDGQECCFKTIVKIT